MMTGSGGIGGPMGGSAGEHNVVGFLVINAKSHPDRAALRWETGGAELAGEKGHGGIQGGLTFAELSGESARLATGLRDAGVSRGDRVLIHLPMAPDLYLSMFAVLRIGAVAVFLDPWSGIRHVSECVCRTRPLALITVPEAHGLISEAGGLEAVHLKIVAGEGTVPSAVALHSLFRAPREVIMESVRPDMPALITFTTGSSGSPKGAVRSHGVLAAQHRALERCIPYRDDDVSLSTFPIFSLNSLAAGVTTVLPAIDLARPSAEDAGTLAHQLISGRITRCMLPPRLLSEVSAYCSDNRVDLASLRRVVTGGAPVSGEVVRLARAAAPEAVVVALYGSTEAEPIALIEGEELLRDEKPEAGVNVGRIVENLEARLIRIHRGPIELDRRGWARWEASEGEVGELVVSGAHVCQEYYDDPEAFREAKVLGADGRIWHRTGDLGRLDAAGRLWIVGRVHNAILRGGKYLFPVGPEMMLKSLQFVSQGAYVGIEDRDLGERACVAVTLKRPSDRDEEGYPLAIRALLSERGIPVDEVRIVDSIPMDPRHRSKVDYSKLREMLK